MKKNIIDSIENLKHNTYSSIKNIQMANIPFLTKLNLERRYVFDIHGFKHPLYTEDSLAYVCNNIPYTPNQIRHEFCDTLDNLVKSKEVHPFLLFLNHEFVKWSNIIILKDCKYSYIIIPSFDYDNEVTTQECIVIPQYVEYKENNNTISETTIFAFDSENNKLVMSPEEGKTYTTINLLNFDEIYFEQGHFKYPNAIRRSKLDPECKLSDENLILFNNGYLCSSFLESEVLPLNLFKMKNVEMVNSLSIDYKIFYFKKSNKSATNIQNIVNKKQVAREILMDNQVPDHISKLNNKFDFRYNRDLSYEENVYNTLEYIMKYNSGLLNNVYKDKSNIISRVYTGTEINAKMDDNGYVTMSRRVNSDASSHVIIFKNGELYKGYSELKYKNKNFIFPVIDINDEDIIEILFFKNVDNRRIKMFFSSLGDDYYIMDSSVNMDNMKLFTMNVESHEFNLERKDSVQYEIGYNYERVDDNKIKIIPDNSFYYDRTLSLSSSRQFRYASKIAKSYCVDFALPDDFKFCNEKEKYMIFINGRKINNENFKVTLYKPTRPFDDISVYVNIALEKGDKIEVIYVPDRLDEIVIQPHIFSSGTVIIDKSKIAYNFDKDLYLLFVNGKKINPNQMIDLDQNKLKITTDVGTLFNLSIIKHIEDEEILASLFNTNKDEITTILDSLDQEEIDKMYGDTNIHEGETSISESENIISMQSVMYKIIKDYYLRPYINTGDTLVYDFDEEFLEKDDDGNIIIRSMDANLEDKLNTIE